MGKGSQRGTAKPSSREITPEWANNMGKRVLLWGWEALGWKGCSHHPCPPTGPLQPPWLPKALLLLENPKERNGKVRQRQMQSPDKKYQGANRFGFFMPKIFAFLFLPWRHKPLLLSHNHLHCGSQGEFQKSSYNGILALQGQRGWSPFICAPERQGRDRGHPPPLFPQRKGFFCRSGRQEALKDTQGALPWLSTQISEGFQKHFSLFRRIL